MLFNSYSFVFVFFPLTLAGFYICQRIEKRAGNLFLFVMSLLFYGWIHPEYLLVLLGSMAVNYLISREIEKRKRGVLFIGVLFNLGMLACFKYMDTKGFVPLGISFFTFTQIAFLVECYRGNLKEGKALSYGLYVSFFPKIMQGPIMLPDEFLPQLEKRNGWDWERIYRSLFLFVAGLSKKVLIADTLGGAVDFGYTNLAALNSGDALIVMLSYTLQLYFDFSGYCDMAMGIAGMLGIELPLNFDSPYQAADILEFWKRWHMTLTRFFTRYLYIPLGGNRKGRLRTYGNCLLVFFVSGLWHGSGLQFLVWGMMHGVLFVVTRAWKDWNRERGKAENERTEDDAEPGGMKRVLEKVSHMGKVLLTFLYVNIAWIFFRAASVSEAWTFLKRIGSLSFGRINRELAACFNLDEFWYVIKILRLDRWQNAHYLLLVLILSALLLLVLFGQSAAEHAKKIKPGIAGAFFMMALFVWSVLSFSGVSSFLYVNF